MEVLPLREKGEVDMGNVVSSSVPPDYVGGKHVDLVSEGWGHSTNYYVEPLHQSRMMPLTALLLDFLKYEIRAYGEDYLQD